MSDLTDRHHRTAEFEVQRADGTRAWVQLRANVHLGSDNRVRAVDGIVRDLTERRAAESDLLRRAIHDPLTGLANRSLFYERLEQALRRVDRLPGGLAVVFLELDRFKDVNDKFGHAVGDELLIEVGRRLSEHVRPGDTVARLGGDEFLVLCEDLTDDLGVDAVVLRLRVAVSAPVTLAGSDLTITASIGAALALSVDEPDDVVHRADSAMYEDKAPPAHQLIDRRRGER